MVQRNALLLAAAITGFVLVLIGGVAAGLVQAATAPVQPAVASPAATAAPATPAPAAAEPTQTPYPVSADQAQAFALQAAPGAKSLRTPELVNFEGTPAYEVTLDLGKVYVDATTGRVLYNGATQVQAAPQPGSGPVTADQAAAIARNYLGGGTVLGVQLAQDDGRTFYVVVFDNRTLVAISADNGQILGVRSGDSAPETQQGESRG